MNLNPDMLDAVCRTLRITSEEHRYVRRLAGVPLQPEVDTADFTAERRAALRSVLDEMLPSAAHVTTRSWDLVDWNSTYPLLLGDPMRLPEGRRNHLWKFFMTPEPRERLINWEMEKGRFVARLRAEEAWLEEHGRLRNLADELLQINDEFREVMERREVHRFVGYIEWFTHPDVGEMRLHLTRMTVVDVPELLLYVHTPTDEQSRRKMLTLAGMA